MKYVAILAAALLFMFLGVSVPSFSQGDDHPQEARDKNKERDKDKDDRSMHQERTKPGEREARPEQNSERPNDRGIPQDESRRNDEHHGNHAQQREQRPMEGHGQGRRIPEDRFRASFGRQHHFHVDRDRIYNQPRPVIVYSGYSFQLVEPWPVEWAYTDDCYIDYDDADDQYYLYDAYHPGIRIAVIVIE